MDRSPRSPASAHASARIVHGGQVAAGEDAAAFTLTAPSVMPLPVLIAVPHGGRAYPRDVLARMRAPELCQLRLEDRHVDAIALAAARHTGAALMVAHAPRAMLDLNRAHSDIDWDMIEGPRLARGALTSAPHHSNNHRARSGLGLIPRRLPGHGEIWRTRLPLGELERRIEQIHQPYHSAVMAELQRIRDQWGAALLLDLHSMPPLIARDHAAPAPVVVLGDRFGASCHHALMRRGLEFCDSAGLEAAPNRPYSGGYVLDRHGAPQDGIHAIQIELCRSLYLDENLANLTPAAARVGKLVAALVAALGRETAALGQARGLREAAE